MELPLHSRRELIWHTALLAGLGSLFSPSASSASNPSWRGGRRGLVLDVACLGNTLVGNFALAPNFPPDPPDSAVDLRGVSFYVEGELYAARTIPGTSEHPISGFDPASTAPLGFWSCRGWFMLAPNRPQPVVNLQEHMLGRVTADTPSPRHTLVSSGVEGIRAVIGGTGRFRTARGEVFQEVIGTNNTTVNVLGLPSPNFRFHFDLG